MRRKENKLRILLAQPSYAFLVSSNPVSHAPLRGGYEHISSEEGFEGKREVCEAWLRIGYIVDFYMRNAQQGFEGTIFVEEILPFLCSAKLSMFLAKKGYIVGFCMRSFYYYCYLYLKKKLNHHKI